LQLVAIDLDGTLLNSTHDLSSRHEAAVRAVRERGVRVILASGRMHASIVPYARQLELDEPIISYNGALVRWDRTGEVLHHLPVSAEWAAEFMAFAREEQFHLNLYFDDVWYSPADSEWAQLYARRTRRTAVFRPDLYEWAASREPTKILCIGPPERIRTAFHLWRERAGNHLYVTTSEPEYLEAMNPAVSKGLALQRLCAHLGLPLAHTMAFGDNLNDQPLLEAAGYGVAMGNSPPEVQAVADRVTGTNDEDGVAQVLEEWLCMERNL
jgi:Cof subfamily protein (haloacid dehalogenase superfamily)